MSSYFLFHDTETTGLNPDFDMILQFAGVKTDLEFNIIKEHNLRAKLRPDVIPHPQALLVNRVTPKQATSEGCNEYEFAKNIYSIMSEPGQIGLGYNTLKFDDEMIRRLFYRNLLDPYSREWRDKNSRSDILNMVFAAYALRPEGLVWPTEQDTTQPNFKLTALCGANEIKFENAHDALADVKATIEIAKLIKTKQPKLFNYMLEMRDKKQARNTIKYGVPMVHVSPFYGNNSRYTSLVLPIANHPNNNNSIIVYDLSKNPEIFFNMDADEIQRNLFTKSEDLSEPPVEIGLKTITLNKSPAIFAEHFLSPEIFARANIDQKQSHQYAKQIMNNEGFRKKAQKVFSSDPEKHPDVDAQIYTGGFFTDHDRRLMQKIVDSDPKKWMTLAEQCYDDRVHELTFRLLARNHYELLSTAQRESWGQYVADKLSGTLLNQGLTLTEFNQAVDKICSDNQLSPEDEKIISELRDYSSLLNTSETKPRAKIPESSNISL